MRIIALPFLIFSLATFGQAPFGIKDGHLLDAADWSQALAAPDQVPVFETEGQDRYLLFRVRQDDAQGLELRFTNLRLPEGVMLYIHNNSGSGARELVGPLTGTGPNETGEMVLLMSGAESYLELQIGQGELAEIPFTLEVTAKNDLGAVSIPETFSAVANGGPSRSIYRDRELEHAVVNGVGIFEGDILLGRADTLERAVREFHGPSRNGAAITGDRYRWPGGVMPYTISAGFPNPQRVTDAIAHWNTKLAGSLQLVARTNQANYVVITDPGNSGVCNSYVGMIGGAQPVNLGSYCSTGNAIHELGHALGLWHEQSRIDRDQFIRVVTENIDPAMVYNFNKNTSAIGIDLGAYDYESIMHYPAYAFSKNGLPTIVTVPAGISIGQRSALSNKDVTSMQILYPAKAGVVKPSTVAKVRVTIGATPTSIPLTIDGQRVTTPAVFDWEVGSQHQLKAETMVSGQTGARAIFARWNLNPAAAFTFTTPAEVTTITAQYTVQYSVKATANDSKLGAVTLAPQSADTFYNSSTILKLEARANANSCFTGWTGLLPTAPSLVQLGVGGPATIVGQFQAGTVTVQPLQNQINKNGGTLSVQVKATGCPWRAQSNADWARLGGVISGTQTGRLTVTVQPNTTGQTRTATISLGGISFAVAQPGK